MCIRLVSARFMIILGGIASTLAGSAGTSSAEVAPELELLEVERADTLPPALAPASRALWTASGWVLVVEVNRDQPTLAYYDPAVRRGRWEVKLDAPVTHLALHGTSIVTVSDSIASFDVDTGERRWIYPLSGQTLLAMTENTAIVAGFLPSPSQVLAIDLDSGRPRWPSWVSVPCPAGAAERDAVVVIATPSGDTVLDAATGRLITSPTGAPTGLREQVANTYREQTSAWAVRDMGGTPWLVGPAGAGPWRWPTAPFVAPCGDAYCAAIGTEVALVRRRAALQVAQRCRESLLAGDASCADILVAWVSAFPEQRAMAQDLVEALLLGARRGTWRPGWAAVVHHWLASSAESDRAAARELGLRALDSALALHDSGRTRDALELVGAVDDANLSIMVRPLRFGLGLEVARELWRNGARALRQGDRAQAQEALDAMVGVDGVTPVLPPTLADAMDSPKALARAYEDVGHALTDGLGGERFNQPLCVARCGVERERCGSAVTCDDARRGCLERCTGGGPQ